MEKSKVDNLIASSEKRVKNMFDKIEDIALYNQQKVLNSFRNNQVALRHFAGTTGYGYDDIGRDTISKIYAEVFGAEKAIVSYNITCGSHALKIALYGILRPGDTMLSVTGKPYDTLDDTIFGVKGEDIGSLKDLKVSYKQIDLKDNDLDMPKIIAMARKKPKLIYFQRSKGYAWRDAISCKKIGEAIKEIRKVNKSSFIMVDNCYGEFVEKIEPCDVGADIIAGSLIKNPGGGIVPTGGYIAGSARAIDMISTSYTSPSLKLEVGSNELGYRLIYQGLFMAPHIVAQALKGSLLIGAALDALGYEVMPQVESPMYDIIRSVKFNKKEELISFCQQIQFNSPIDSYVTPEPWDMPGYNDPVIMAAGTFVQGSSLELSSDAPIKEPYVLYIQGGLTYEHVKLALIGCLSKL